MRTTRRLMQLPFDPPQPTLAEVEASAIDSPLLAAVGRLRDHVGPDGYQLTAAGGIRFDTESEVNALLGLPEFQDPGDGPDDRPLCFNPLPRGTLALAVAVECGAVDVVDNRLVAVPSWDDEDVIVRAAVALSTLIDLGPMGTSVPPGGHPFADLRNEVLDRTYVHWLVTLLPEGRCQDVDHFVNWASDECRENVGCDPFPTPGEFDMWIENGTCYLIDSLVWAGALVWSGRETRRTELHGGVRWFGGGSVRLTPLARHVLPDHLADAGIRLRDPDDPANPSPAGLLGNLIMTEGADARRAMVAAWRPDLDAVERARLIAAELLDADNLLWHWAGFEALDVVGADVAAPFVRQLLDSPASEDAAQFLVEHGLADADALREFMGLRTLIGMIGALANRPEELKRWLVRLLETVEAPELLLQVIAMHATPEAAMLLTAAARHVDDPRFAEMIHAAESLLHDCLADMASGDP
jgi:hypothetical protein